MQPAPFTCGTQKRGKPNGSLIRPDYRAKPSHLPGGDGNQGSDHRTGAGSDQNDQRASRPTQEARILCRCP